MKRAHTSSDCLEEDSMSSKQSLKDEETTNPTATQCNETFAQETVKSESSTLPQEPPDQWEAEHKPNKDQQYLIDHVIKHIESKKDQLDLFVEGTVGTGKTTLFRLLHKKLLEYYKDYDSVLLIAPTGRAAYTIGGETAHSAFAIPYEDVDGEEEFKDDEDTEQLMHDKPESEMSDQHSELDNKTSGKYSKSESKMVDEFFEMEWETSERYVKLESDMRKYYSERYANIRVLMIYDVFMMPSDVYEYVDGRLQEIKNQETPFGGLHVIKFGDFKQLPPYGVNPVFECELWKKTSKYYQLRKVLGPKDNREYGKLLQRFAYGRLSEDVIIEFGSREFQDPQDAPILCFNNNVVDWENENATKGHCGKDSIAVDKEVDHNFVVKGHARTLIEKITLVKGLRYSLTQNLDVRKGLVNGLIGTLKDITLDEKDSDKVKSVSIEFSENSGLCLKEPFSETITRIKLVCEIDGKRILRDQLPIRIAEAMTTHRSQGFTYDRVTVVQTSWTKTHQYTAFSRVKALDKLFLRGQYDRPSKDDEIDVNKELIRLQKNCSITDPVK